MPVIQVTTSLIFTAFRAEPSVENIIRGKAFGRRANRAGKINEPKGYFGLCLALANPDTYHNLSDLCHCSG